MKILVRTGVLVALLFAPTLASAQITGCGSINISTDVFQNGTHQQITNIAQTKRNADGCVALSRVRVESWIDGVNMQVLTKEDAGLTASVYYTIGVPWYGRWNGVGKHWFIFGWGWSFAGYSHDEADIRQQEEDPPPPTDENCNGNDDMYIDSDGNAHPCADSPLLLDVERDGFQLTSPEDGVRFDLDCDGVAEQIAWTPAGGDDVWLALDRNGNGTIDNGCELFGNHTPAYAARAFGADTSKLTAQNGFDALKFLLSPDFGASNGDDIIDKNDAPFRGLLAWNDADHNGVASPGELKPVASLGLVSIDTRYTERKRVDEFGNQFKLKGTATWVKVKKNGKEKEIDRPIWDVWLRREQ